MCLEHDAFLENSELTHGISKGFFAVEHFEVDDSNAPNINFGGDDRFLLGKAFRWEVPVGSHSLRGQFNGILLGGFAQTEISYFDSTLVEEDVLRLQVIVDDFIGQFMQIPDS